MNRLKELSDMITSINCEKMDIEKSFIDIAEGFASQEGTVILLSGGDLDSSRYNILGIRPWMIFSCRGEEIYLRLNKKELRFTANPFDVLKIILDSCSVKTFNYSLPVACGLFGYLSYDLKDCLERLPRTSMKDSNLPDLYLSSPSVILIHDRQEKVSRVCWPDGPFFEKYSPDEVKNILLSGINSGKRHTEKISAAQSGLISNFTQPQYERAITKIREYISSGDVYQVNMSQRFETDFNGEPFELFRKFFNKNPAPFYAYINAEDHHIVSTSPERFLKRDGTFLETRPIKGTMPRSRDKSEDAEMRIKLENSQKDDAELSMIVDLMRNDLGKVCEVSSVRVSEHKRIEAYENVYHLVSIVEGKLDKKYDSVDLIRATFPGGSITGCPKIRAMEIIDELESCRRHVYTGAIGYISFHDTMDLSIAIRVATVLNDRILFSVGGGVVYDSNPADEYKETLHKGKTLMEMLKEENACKEVRKESVWLNGRIAPAKDAVLNVADPGIQYGDGFFETIRVESCAPMFLNEHMERFHHSWRTFFDCPPPDLTYRDIIQQVIVANGFENETMAVKIMAFKGSRAVPPWNHSICVTARPYVHRLESRKEKGLRLGTYTEFRCSPLADHKTLNYLYYLTAGRWAAGKNHDEAIILNQDRTVSETNSGNILCIKDRVVIQPLSNHVLSGIMEKQLLNNLEKLKYTIKREKVMIDDLFRFDTVLVTNSLMGAVPVLSVDTIPLKRSEKVLKEIKACGLMFIDKQ